MREFINADCMQYMTKYPDNYFDLAICDPPYGGGAEPDAEKTFGNKNGSRFGGRFDKYMEIKASRRRGGWAKELDPDGKVIKWDIAPPAEYFNELFRISKNQIIWGGVIISSYRQHAVLSCGARSQYPNILQWLWLSTHGRVLTEMQRYLNMRRKIKRVFTQRKSQ